jgi:hypothetical protein
VNSLTKSATPEHRLENLLLKIGGNRVLSQGPDPQLAELLKRGRSFPLEGLRRQVEEEHRCHSNTSRLWYESHGGIKIATGYALAEEGFWHQHTWGLDDGRVVETTSPRRERYFGVELTLAESVRFAMSNRGPDFQDQLRRDMATGSGYRECLGYIKAIATHGMSLRYFDVARHWTKRIEPHLSNKRLNRVLVRDFNKYTTGRWRKRFKPGQLPSEFEHCDWQEGHRGKRPRYWDYVKSQACHWLVNFNLTLARLARPDRAWRIITSHRHSTVWDGERTLFDLNFLAFGVPPQECFDMAYEEELPVGEYRKAGYPRHWGDEMRERDRMRTEGAA